MIQPLPTWLLVWLAVASAVTFALFASDKLLAMLRWPRIPETVLHVLSALGGILGALLAMTIFHHKTSKRRFMRTSLTILAMDTSLILAFWWLATGA